MFSPRDLATWTRFGVTFQGNAMDFFPANSDKANSIQRFLPSYTVLSFQENSWSWIIFLDALPKNPSNLGETMDLHDLDRVGTTAGEARMKLRFGSDERFLRQLVDEALNEMRTEAYWNTEFTFFLKTRVLLEKIFLGVFNIVSVHINMADGFVRSFTISNHILGRSQIWDHYRFGQLIPTHPNWTPFVITSGLFCFGRMLSRWVQLSNDNLLQRYNRNYWARFRQETLQILQQKAWPN